MDSICDKLQCDKLLDRELCLVPATPKREEKKETKQKRWMALGDASYWIQSVTAAASSTWISSATHELAGQVVRMCISYIYTIGSYINILGVYTRWSTHFAIAIFGMNISRCSAAACRDRFVHNNQTITPYLFTVKLDDLISLDAYRFWGNLTNVLSLPSIEDEAVGYTMQMMKVFAR